MALPADLEQRCLLLAARAAAGQVDPLTAVRLARDLIEAGFDTPTVAVLGARAPDGMSPGEARLLAEDLLLEVGMRSDPEHGAVVLLLEGARRHVAGDLSTAELASLFWGLWRAAGHPARFNALGQVLDDWERGGSRRRAERADAVRDEARRVSSGASPGA
jgi:hypothetical protein